MSQPLSQPADPRLQAPWAALHAEGTRVLSLDVFDTLLWRTVAEPVDVFPQVAARLRAQGLLRQDVRDTTFARLRVAGEAAARLRRSAEHDDLEVDLREVYEAIPAWCWTAGTGLAEVMAAELEAERSVLVADLGVAELVLEARRLGLQVVVVSDNYLGSARLRPLLLTPPLHDVVWDEVFCSCDARTGKGDRLFEIVVADLGVDPSSIVHLGDNHAADVEQAEKAGIQGFWFPRATQAVLDLGRAEEDVVGICRHGGETASSPGDDGGLTSLRGKVLAQTAGAVPSARRPHFEWGATVLGPVLVGFAEAVCDAAVARGLSEVHCLMREGAVLGDLINDEAARRGIALRARPLWVNRRVALAASLDPTDLDTAFEQLVAGRTAPTLSEVVELLGLTLSDVPALARHQDTRLNDPTLRASAVHVLGAEHLRTRIHRHLDEARRAVADLLMAETADPDLRMLVDIGWGGTIQTYLNRALRFEGSSLHLVGHYLITDRRAVDAIVEGNEVLGWLADCGSPREAVELVLRSPEVLEQSCSAPIGSQRGLTRDGRPLVEESGLSARQRAEAETVRAGMRAFAGLWSQYATIAPDRVRLADLRERLLAVLVRASVAPTPEEVLAFGDWEHDEGRGTTRLDRIAGLEHERLARYATPAQLRDLPMQDLYWPFGLAVRTSPATAQLISAAAAGRIGWDALDASTPEVGFQAAIAEGLGLEEAYVDHPAPAGRNGEGRSLGVARLSADRLDTLELRFSEEPHVLRLDWLALGLWRHGSPDPDQLELDDLGGLLQHEGYLAMGDHMYYVPHHQGRLLVTLPHVDHRLCFRADVTAGFAMIAVPAPLDPPRAAETANVLEGLERARAALAELQGSPSWRMTEPLRKAKRVSARLRG